MAKPRLKESLGTNLLVSFLIRYPELSTMRYNPQAGTCWFTVLLKGEVSAEKQVEFVAYVNDYFAACRELDSRFSPVGRITHQPLEGITSLVYEQQLTVLNQAEVRLFVQLTADFYQGLVGETELTLAEDERNAQEEIIETILGKKQELVTEKMVVAYRDGGRVFVYNK